MRIKMRILMVALIILSLCGCLEQLQQLNNALSTASKPLQGGGTMSAGGGTMSAAPMPKMSEAQSQSFHFALSRNPTDQSLAQAKAQAGPTIEKILAISACYSEGRADTFLRQYSMAGTSWFYMPMYGMHYHPRNKCLTLTRLDSWKMLARNAFSFRAVFVSEESGESSSVMYQMRRQPEGEWLMSD